jgi:DNA polymerase-3 subunit delta'
VNALLQGRLPSQFLFVGPEGIGKKRFAWGMAEVLLCQRPIAPGEACGLCASCVKIRSGFHENVLAVEPEKNLIKMERAREIQDFLSLAQSGGSRVIIVNDAHTLNAQAANSLLKVFEEPPPNTYFFFITHRWMQVLPTIRSRATRVAFAPLKESDLEPWSKGDVELLRLARGSVKELLEQKEDSRREVREDAFALLAQFFNDKSFFVLGSWRDTLKDKDKLLLFIRYWLMVIKESLVHRYEGADPSKSGWSPLLQGLSKVSAEDLWSLWERGLHLEAGLLGHRDPVLLVEEWLMPLMIKD